MCFKQVRFLWKIISFEKLHPIKRPEASMNLCSSGNVDPRWPRDDCNQSDYNIWFFFFCMSSMYFSVNFSILTLNRGKGGIIVTVFLWLQKRLSSQSFCDSRNDYLSLSLSLSPRLCLSVLSVLIFSLWHVWSSNWVNKSTEEGF